MLDATETAGRLAIVEHTIAPGVLAAPVHRHQREDEYSYVLEGHLGASFDGVEVYATAGDFVRWARQVIDVLDQLANVPGDARRSRACRRAADLVSRGVVATSLPAASAPRADED